jgi:hypothetical protein
MTAGSPFGSYATFKIEKGFRASCPKPHLTCIKCEWSYGDSNPRPLACHESPAGYATRPYAD